MKYENNDLAEILGKLDRKINAIGIEVGALEKVEEEEKKQYKNKKNYKSKKK